MPIIKWRLEIIIISNYFVGLKEFKITQVLEDIISWGYGLFSSEEKGNNLKSNETLMARMIGESLITFDSDINKLLYTLFPYIGELSPRETAKTWPFALVISTVLWWKRLLSAVFPSMPLILNTYWWSPVLLVTVILLS